MTSLLVATDGDTETQDCAHVPCVGDGTYNISPVTLQGFVYIGGKLVIPDGQTFEAHGTAECVASTSLLYINGIAVVRDNDTIDHHHNNTGVDVVNQLFVYSE
jgi:hypothetical protein